MSSLLVSMILLSASTAGAEPAARPSQNPSPMVEHTRRHPRLKEQQPAGERSQLQTGTLFVPESLPKRVSPLLLHFHGPTWIAEIAAAKIPCAVIAVQAGAGSSVYGRLFSHPEAFANLITDAERKSNCKFGPIMLSAWSAGYGAIRQILKTPQHYELVDAVLLLDGLHCSYVNGQPGPKESSLVADDLSVFVTLAQDAARGKKQLLLTHTEIFPGTFASTTETADYLLNQLQLTREPVLRWGPMGTQVLGEARRGQFQVLSFAGNSAPDHIDLLHSLPELLEEIDCLRCK